MRKLTNSLKQVHKIIKLFKAGAKNKYTDEKKKNHPIFYSRGRERERERIVPNLKRGHARAVAWVCCERESEVKGKRKFVNAEMERTASNT
jgi:hypothetical protein